MVHHNEGVRLSRISLIPACDPQYGFGSICGDVAIDLEVSNELHEGKTADNVVIDDEDFCIVPVIF